MPQASGVATALTIAGSDSSGGAGIQADLKTFTAFAVYGASVITAITAQNTQGVVAVEALAPRVVVAQLDAVLGDLEIAAVKTGMLASGEIVRAVAARLAREGSALVVDPVMAASSGYALLDADGIEAMKRTLLPRATLLTPNLSEAAKLLNAPLAASEAEMIAQAKALKGLGCEAVLLKGGHAGSGVASDVLYDGGEVKLLSLARVATDNDHGTGCVLAAAITALLAHGVPLADAVVRAKNFVWKALNAGRTLGLGHGRGPVDVLHTVRGRPLPA